MIMNKIYFIKVRYGKLFCSIIDGNSSLLCTHIENFVCVAKNLKKIRQPV